MRIRTDGDYAHREDTIRYCADYYDVNKTAALLNAAEDVPSIVAAAADVLQRDDLTTEQKREIAERFNEARGVEFEVEETVSVEKG